MNTESWLVSDNSKASDLRKTLLPCQMEILSLKDSAAKVQRVNINAEWCVFVCACAIEGKGKRKRTVVESER